MKFSFRYLSKFLNPLPGVDELADLLTFCGLEVEHVEEWYSHKYGLKNIVVGQVVKVWPHPKADRLVCTLVNIGGERILQIVCGAPNVKEGQKVVVALEGAKLEVPGKGLLTIQKTLIRGQVSEGMLCAPDEIGIDTSHEGILVLEDEAKPGTPASEYFHVQSDVIFTVNITPNRPDATHHLGLARDVRAALNARSRPTQLIIDWMEQEPIREAEGPIPVFVEASEAAPYYTGCLVEGLTVGPSPEWLKYFLESCGYKSVNNVVDVANMVMLELGQPLHFFDADKLQGSIRVRWARAGEKLLFLDGVERTLQPSDLVIADESKAHCLAGIMGGKESAVALDTQRIFIESAWFHPTVIRKSARYHRLNTEASYRFERRTDPAMVKAAVERALFLLKELAGARPKGGLVAIGRPPMSEVEIPFSPSQANHFLGTDLAEEEMVAILNDLGFSVETLADQNWIVRPPSFRADVLRWQDVAEEIIRIAGFQRLASSEVIRFSPPQSLDESAFEKRRKIAHRLSHLGFTEIITYPMVNPDLVGTDEHTVHLKNPISQEMSVLRRSLLESMLPVAVYNIHRQMEHLKLFEIGRIFKKMDAEVQETEVLGILVTGARYPDNWYNPRAQTDFYFLKGVLNSFPGWNLDWHPESSVWNGLSGFLLTHPKDGIVGYAVQPPQSWLEKLDLDKSIYFVQVILTENLLRSGKRLRHLAPPRFPVVRRDLAFLVPKNVPFKKMEEWVWNTGGEFLRDVELFDVYEGKNIPADHRSIALRLIFRNDERTLTDEEVQKAVENIATSIEQNCQATWRKG
ncbi:MAG: phenylalanine--tRNA ligase subunit beta [Flavobacteriales bacterium]|nr:phenylalanine--tRNA ligase subunit beta [Flavobacteriales bacterium]MDW8409473.1 phenylalanine--tRNA ligase subunit beta [Flavobacteriales bacterium]